MNKKMTAALIVLMFALSAPAFAKHEGNPPGWSKGEKKGWNGGTVPPGVSKADAKKAERDARDARKKADKEAKKQAKEAKKQAEKQQKEAEKAAAEAKSNVQNAVS